MNSKPFPLIKTATLEFKLKDLLGTHSVQELQRTSGLTRMSIYNILNGYHKGLKYDTIASLCYGLSLILNRRIDPNDLMIIHYPGDKVHQN